MDSSKRNKRVKRFIIAEIEDVNRFPDEKKIFSYAGLVPSVRKSGGKVQESTLENAIAK